MEIMTETTGKFFKDEKGATAVEYAAVLGFIIAVCAVGYEAIGTTTLAKVDSVADIFP